MALILSRNMKSLWFPLTCKLTSPSQLWELACWDWGASAVRRYPLPVLGAGKPKVRSPAGYSVCHGLSFWLVESGCALPGSYFRGQRTQVFPSPLLVSIPPLPNFLLRAAISNHSQSQWGSRLLCTHFGCWIRVNIWKMNGHMNDSVDVTKSHADRNLSPESETKGFIPSHGATWMSHLH